MRAFTLLATALPLALRAAAASNVIDLIPSNFDSIVLQSGKPSLVEFFAPWCGHCKNLAPVYEELGNAFAAQSRKVNIAKVDADEHKELGKRFGIQGFPTLKWFDGKSETPEDYSGGRDIESLTAWITDKTGVRPKGGKKVTSQVVVLTDATFGQEVGGEKNVLVAFTAPWCGHCKALAPTWESLASTFSAEQNITIAKVDAESPNSKVVATAQGVTSYPTIKFFPRGSSTAEDYEGGRSEPDFVSFVNSKAGTHRVAGGALDAVAGTIASVDELVQAYIKAPSATALDAITAAAGEAKDTTGSYYVKVAKKIGVNPKYTEKELTRLESLLAKGGLAPEKVDDLTRRSNILRVFKGGVEEVVDKVAEAAEAVKGEKDEL